VTALVMKPVLCLEADTASKEVPKAASTSKAKSKAADDWWAIPTHCSDMSYMWQREWNNDWDGRAPPVGFDVKTTGRVRHLLFIRHGQYELDSADHGLTELGREQSRLVGQRLAAEARGVQKDHYGEVRVQYAGIWVSTVERAMQTADIISECLPGVPKMTPDPFLAEGRPTVPHPKRTSRVNVAETWEDSARIEAAFRRYFHRDVDHKRLADREKKEKVTEEFVPATKPEASEAPKVEHTYEIIVCHMNVIRFFVMRALQLPPEAWLRLRGDNTGITEIIIQPSGSVSLSRFADVGHLPIEMVTFH